VSAWFAAHREADHPGRFDEPPAEPIDPVAAPVEPVAAPEPAEEDAARPLPTREFATAADAGWRASAGAAVQRAAETTAAGLPKRRPHARLVPGSAGPAVRTPEAPASRSAEDVRNRLATHQQGVRQGRGGPTSGDAADDSVRPIHDRTEEGT
jgi:hypothetical protein